MTAPKALVLEDDKWSSPLMELALKEALPGVEVETVESVSAAVAKTRENEYRLIVADIFVLGSQNGVAFWDHCQEACPEAALLLTSSLSHEEFERRFGRLRSNALYLMKPYDVRELTRTLAAMVDFTGFGA